MRVILLTFLTFFSFSALAITTTFTVDVGSSNSRYHGHSRGVVQYSSSDTASSTLGAMHSEKSDSVTGTQHIRTGFHGHSNTRYMELSANLNGAEFSRKTSRTRYANYSNTRVVDRFRTSGFELDTQVTPLGSSFEYSEYNGRFVTRSYSRDSNRGFKREVETSWY